ncbi:ABC transporter permease [Nocardia huaxiensis]|uniref:ABC transporter permease n=1 Tax=Nocardia huaxiensis TaxID=2755382 RepID=A0A7D6V697_9NOCA|nr:ABC transporter permease [Nocardia huaxiensis]QLY28552.1 ABC transporter permease [Nocardia huaxiensis]UFS97981.1 ABC transporter permease [Nocardia huaxiensis]
MSTTAVRPIVADRAAEGETVTGAGTLFRFALRRERFTLPFWLLGAAALLAFQSVGSQNFYDTPQKLAQLRQTMSASAATVAMGGPTKLLDTIGGEVLFEIFAYLVIVAGLMNMFLVGRHTRSDEETGRAELIRSARVGRRAPTVAALGVAAVADVALALTLFAAAVATGLPAAGSVLTGVAVAGAGFTFAAVTAVAAQLFENPRSVYGSVTLTLAAAYVVRAIGDVGPDAVAWASPFGWGQRTYPYVSDRWWPLLLFALASAVLVGVACVVLDRRDFGAGLFGYGTGRARASWALRAPLGLALRLQRGSLFAWTAGVFTLGGAYGAFADSIEDYLRDYPELSAYFPGGAESAVNSYLALTLSMMALLAAAYGIVSTLRARGEETAGRAELILSAPVSRSRWLAGQLVVALAGSAVVLAAGGVGIGLSYALTVADPGQIARTTGSAVVYLPAVWVVIAGTALAFGWFPRASLPAAWTVFAYCVVGVMFANSFDLPGWFDDASPFAHTPRAPWEPVTAAPIIALLLVAALLAGGALTGFRRRDLG